MKTFKQILVVCAITLAFSNANAQDANNPWIIKLGANVIDAYPTNLPGSDLYGPQGKWFSGFFNTKDHWNILPCPALRFSSHY